jgi:hypothetical protein
LKTTDRELEEILAEIGLKHRAIEAPQRLEAALRAEAGRRKDSIGARRLRLSWTSAAAAILLAVIATSGAIWQLRNAHRHEDHPVLSVQVPQAMPEQPLASAQIATRNHAEAPASVRARRARTDRPRFRETSTKRKSPNSLDEFVPLPVSEGLPPASELSVVRIKLRGNDLRQYGLEAPADAAAQTMLAEFVVGEDGLPRAIRIVR